MVYCLAHLHFSVGRNSDALNRLKPITKRSSCRNFFHHKSYSFLSRTVRLTNSNPKALLLGCRGTLAQNRGTMGGVQIPFSFPKSLDFKPLQTKVQILLWQMNRTQIGVIIYLLSPRMPCLAGFLGYFVKCSENADYGKSEQN